MKTLFTLLGMLVFGSILAQDKIYLHQATPSTISGNTTYIDHPDLNGNPNAPIVFSQNIGDNDNELSIVFNDNPVGLAYDAGFDGGRWAIFNENLVDMPVNAKFNIFIADDSEVYTHIATPANIVGNTTIFDIPEIDQSSFVTFSTYYNPNGVLNTNPYGTFFFLPGDRGILSEDGNPIPEGAAFKVMRATPTSATRITQTSAEANITWFYTIIDHPELNGNPNATFVYDHYFGAGFVRHVPTYTGVWYTGTHWAIANQDLTAFTEGARFDIVIAEQEVLSTSNFEQVQATLFPNPASDILNVQANSGLQKIIIHNLLGQEVFKQNLENTTATLDVSTLSSGQYIATITTQEGVANQKFIKK